MLKTKREKGQTIVLVVISVLIMVVMAALVVDGGNAYLKRRQAQTAADAAALAAAQEFCINKGTLANADAVAAEYALVQNDATAMVDLSPEGAPDGVAPFILIDTDNKEVSVAVEMTQSSVFARMLNRPTITVTAEASAGCFPPGATDHIIPIAWSCRPPVGTTPSDSEDCTWKAIPWNVFENILADPLFNPIGDTGTVLYHDDTELPPVGTGELELASEYMDNDALNETMQLYIVMDSIPLAEDIGCEVDTEVDPVSGEVTIVASYCDLDGDGRFDVSTSDRSWLILNGDENNGQLDDIVLGKMDIAVDLPTWFPGRSGNIVDVYKDAASADGIEGKPSLIPVFEVFCSPTADPTSDPLCASLAESGDGLEQLNTAASGTYFRVIAFAEFYTTCVSYHKDCPGKTYLANWLSDLADSGVITKQQANIDNVFTIEGYFIDGWAGSTMEIGQNTIDLGIYILSLTE